MASKFTDFFGTFTMFATWDAIIDYLSFFEETDFSFGETDRKDFGFFDAGSVTICKGVDIRLPFALDDLCPTAWVNVY